jgi:tetratricopeptide (TPR) repeat protein
LGDFEGALQYYRKQLESFRADLAADSTNVQFRRDLAVGFGNVGDALANLSRYQEALEYYGNGRQIRAAVLAADPRDMGALRDLAFIDRAIGFAHAGAERRSEALVWLDRAANALGRVYAVDANNRWIRGQLVGTLQRTAAVALESGNGGAARSHAGRALDVLRRAADSPEATGAELNAYAWTLLTVPVAALQDPVRAVSIAERAVAASGGKEPNYLDTLAHAYHRTGERDRAIATAERVLELVPPGHPGRGEFEATLATVRDGVA